MSIYLTQKEYNDILNYNPETGILAWKVYRSKNKIKPGDIAGYKNPRGYHVLRIGKHNHLVHRVIWIMVHGVIPDQIDHINRIPSDNRLINLRDCNTRTNNLNRKLAEPESGHYGVYKTKSNKWHSEIKVNGKRINLGNYIDINDAINARKQAEELYNEEISIERNGLV